jgi:hypothetical protein
MVRAVRAARIIRIVELGRVHSSPHIRTSSYVTVNKSVQNMPATISRPCFHAPDQAPNHHKTVHKTAHTTAIIVILASLSIACQLLLRSPHHFGNARSYKHP